jgi:hypothetical protein
MLSIFRDFLARPNDRLVSQFFIEGYDRRGRYLGSGRSGLNDLLLNNFGALLSAYLISGGSSYESVNVTDISNSSVSLTGYGVPISGEYAFLFQNSGAYLAVGSSSTSPARTDHALGSILGVWTLSLTAAPNYSTSTFQVQVLGSITLGSGGTVAEGGIALVGFNTTGGVTNKIMMAHDLISPSVVIPIGGTVSAWWTLQC